MEANSRDHRRIIGGDEADIKDFPYIGAFLLKGRQQFCGAALISNDTVVTAAHCVQEYYNNTNANLTELSVRFGSSQCHSGGQEIFVKQVTIHQEYPTFAPDYDIAVVKLNGSIMIHFTVYFIAVSYMAKPK